MNGGWGVRWTVKWKLNRKKEKNWIPTGGCAPPPVDPPLPADLILSQYPEFISFLILSLLGNQF